MQLVPLSKECPDGNTCPAMFMHGVDAVIVQGSLVGEDVLAQLRLGEGETAVTVPLDLLREAVQRC